MDWQPFTEHTVIAVSSNIKGALLVERNKDGKRALIAYDLERAQLRHGNSVARISDAGIRYVVPRWYTPRYASRLYADVVGATNRETA